MNYEQAKQWADALRSGKYKQGRGYLRTTDNKYCCLGVLCDLTPNVNWEEEPHRSCLTINNEGEELPKQVRTYWGLNYSLGTVPIELAEEYFGLEDVNCLSEANDAGATFDQIADFIEQHYDEL